MGTPHKHVELIKAWADGAKIQLLSIDKRWEDVERPIWDSNTIYRIKPEPKKAQIRFFEDKSGVVRCWTNTWKRSWEQVEKMNEFNHWLGPVEEREFNV